jgi:predicted AAA+ superfamily ATPase
MITILNKLSKRFLSTKPSPFKRFLYEKIDFSAKIIGIVGGRGSGKTTLIHQYAKSSKHKSSQILYISCDHPSMINENLYNLADDFYTHGGKLLLLDEIHKIKEFASHIKSIYDFTDLQVIFSGSSAMNISHEIGDLSRRALIYTMPVLSFREYLSLKNIVHLKAYTLEEIVNSHEDIVVEILSEIKPLEHFSDYLEYGAYPFFKEGVNSYSDRLLEVVKTTVDSDLASIFNINYEKLDALKKVLYMLCSTSPYEVNKSKLSNSAGVSWSTLSKYLEYMQKGSLLNIIRGSKGHKTIQTPNKILLNNPNLFAVLCAKSDIGAIRESFIVSQLLQNHQLHYHHQGDFLVNDKIVIEIGGRSKDKKQIVDIENAYLAIDELESGYDNVIPLWLFGFLY